MVRSISCTGLSIGCYTWKRRVPWGSSFLSSGWQGSWRPIRISRMRLILWGMWKQLMKGYCMRRMGIGWWCRHKYYKLTKTIKSSTQKNILIIIINLLSQSTEHHHKVHLYTIKYYRPLILRQENHLPHGNQITLIINLRKVIKIRFMDYIKKVKLFIRRGVNPYCWSCRVGVWAGGKVEKVAAGKVEVDEWVF